MARPSKKDVVSLLERFAEDLEGVLRTDGGGSGVRNAGVIESLAAEARNAAQALLITDTEAVRPSAAQMLWKLAEDVHEVADASGNRAHATSLYMAESAVKNFILKHRPVRSGDEVRFDDEN